MGTTEALGESGLSPITPLTDSHKATIRGQKVLCGNEAYIPLPWLCGYCLYSNKMGQRLFLLFSNMPDWHFQDGARNNVIANQMNKFSMTFWGEKSS